VVEWVLKPKGALSVAVRGEIGAESGDSGAVGPEAFVQGGVGVKKL
jgi:hypothetical protein